MPKDSTSNEQRIVDFFQDVADEGEDADIYKLAKENGIRDPDKVLTELAGIAGADYRNNGIANFPIKTLEYYNRGLAETGDLLNAHDIEMLQPVIERYGDRLKRQYEQKQQQGFSRMAETFGAPPPQTQPTPPPMYPMTGGIVLPQPDPRADAEAELLRSFLSANYNPRPHLIPAFIDQQFKPYYDYFTQNPGALLQSLTHNFASAGKMAYDMWIANKSRVNMDPYAAQAQYGYTNPAMPIPPPSQIPFMSSTPVTPQPKTQEEMIDEQRWARMEKMMNRNMQLKYMEMMSGFGGNGNNNQLQPPPGTAYTQEPMLDIHGRPTGQYRYIPVAVGNGDNEAFKILAQSLQAQVQTLLQNQQSPNQFLSEVFKVVLPSLQAQNRDPFDSFGKVMEVSEKLAQHKQPDTKPLEAISKEIDAKLALRQIESNERREEREFRREIEGEKTASENTRGYIDTIKEVVNAGIKPFAGGLLQQQQMAAQQQQAQQQQQGQAQVSEAEQMQMQAIQQAQLRQQEQQRAIEQARVLQQEQKLRDAQAMAQRRPTEEVIAERTDGQLEQDFSELDMQRRHLERIFQQVSAERAKRRMIRSGGIATRAQQQVVFASPEAGPVAQQEAPSFADRVQEQQVAAGNMYSDNTQATTAAVTTHMNEDDMEALRASKDGGGVAPMEFRVGGSPNAERQQEIEQGLSTEPGFEEEEEYEEGDEEPEPAKE